MYILKYYNKGKPFKLGDSARNFFFKRTLFGYFLRLKTIGLDEVFEVLIFRVDELHEKKKVLT